MNAKFTLPVLLTILIAACLSCQNSIMIKDEYKPIYTVDLSQSDKRSLPIDFLILRGDFMAHKLGPEYALYLNPNEGDGNIMFGPEITSDFMLSCEVFSGQLGEIYPRFAVGTNGLSGLQLRVIPNKDQAELQLVLNNSYLVAKAPITWNDKAWTSIKLRVLKDGENYRLSGKAWPTKQTEPDWLIDYTGKVKLDKGQCSLWGWPTSKKDTFFQKIIISIPE